MKMYRYFDCGISNYNVSLCNGTTLCFWHSSLNDKHVLSNNGKAIIRNTG